MKVYLSFFCHRKGVQEGKEALEKLKYLCLEKYRELLIQACMYGFANNFNQEPTLPNLSHEFSIDFLNDRFSVSLYPAFLMLLNKRMQLNYDYNQTPSNRKNNIKISNELFHLDTNIMGMKKLFAKEGSNEQPMIQLLDHLAVDYNNLPYYLQKELEKVKKL